MLRALCIALLFVGSTAAAAVDCDPAVYRVGAGVYDITGPAAELRMLGYAMLHQVTAGIRTRLRSRAFVIESPCSNERVALVTADLGLLTQAVHTEVLRQLRRKHGHRYRADNVLLAATHTHSGPGGYSHYLLYDLTILGFSEASFRIAADGIVESIERADANLEEASIRLAHGEVSDTGINRSREAYLQNPAAERDRYATDVDSLMTLLRFDGAGGRPIGMLNWYGVHATSVGNQNRLINGDNKGYAAYQVERRFGTDYAQAKTFVAAFAQGAEGDVSPNIFGGTDGGGADDYESAAISGGKQAARALELMDSATEPLRGPIETRMAYVAMDEVNVAAAWTGAAPADTCPAAIGYSMLAGAEDGRGFGREGLSCAAPSSLAARAACWATTNTCQAEKPVVFVMGGKWPHPFTPNVLPLQIVRIGQLAVVAVPFELTTMAGRRLREAVARELAPLGVTSVVSAGLANAYAGYIATREEYRVQHYEGASTHFGPWTLAALLQETTRLATAMREGRPVEGGSPPDDLTRWQLSVPGGPTHDATPLGVEFGEVYTDARSSYRSGEEVRVSFAGAHLANDARIQDTFLLVERRDADGWQRVADDGAWETAVMWERDYCLPALACSTVSVVWQIPPDAEPGTYRIRHFGSWRSKWKRQLTQYEGISSEFQIVANAAPSS